MPATIVNAAPQTNMLGTLDKSTRALVAEAEALPTHLPKIYGYAKKGPTTPQMVIGGSRSGIYGEDSFDLRMPWATHATVLSNIINGAGNAQMFQRVKPADAGPNATIRLWLDVLATTIPVYERNSDGSIQVDVDGDPVPAAGNPTVAGYKIKWVAEEVAVPLGVDSFGTAAQKAGDQVDGAAQSVRYPVLDLRVSHFGAYGNDLGIRLWAPTTQSSIPLDDRLLTSKMVYPFRMACVGRANALATPKVIESMSAEQFVTVCLKPDTIDPNTDTLVYLNDVFLQAYQDLNNPGTPPVYGPFGELKVYNDNVATILSLLYAAEFAAKDSFSDLTGEAGEEFRLNIFGATTANGVPYQAVQVVTGGVGAVRPTENTTIYAQGGSDGTMSEALFADLVTTEVAAYADPNSYLQDTARYPESIIYDSGFPLATKYALCSFIAVRKDTAVVLSTHDTAGLPLTASQESALAVALRTRLQMYPESEYYGTPTMRGMIIGRSGLLMNSQYKNRLPLTLEIAAKAAAYMGASNGRWKPGFAFDMAPANNVSMFTDVNVTFTPATVRNKDWDNGLNWVESYSRRALYFPALQTVYDNDTSVLNSFFTMMACVELEKVGDRARRAFSGVSSLTNAQLVERVNSFVTDNTTGRFDDRFVIEPDAYFTQADIARGYSWTLVIRIYAPNMKSVMTLSIEAHRIEELTA